MENRHPGWVGYFIDEFKGKHEAILHDLRLIDADLHNLEQAAFH
jgi:hypothetical protein